MGVNKKYLFLVIFAVAYFFGFLLTSSVAYKIPISEFAGYLGASQAESYRAYIIGAPIIGVILIALPIALLMPLIFKEGLVKFALLASVLPVVSIVWSFFGAPLDAIPWAWVAFDSIKFLIFIPLLAWAFSKMLPYNKAV